MSLQQIAFVTREHNRLKLRESAADVATERWIIRFAVAPPQAPRIRCGCRVHQSYSSTTLATASSSENPLRMSHNSRGGDDEHLHRLKLRDPYPAVRVEPPQAPRIRCGCRREGRLHCDGGAARLKLRESAADVAGGALALRRGGSPPQAPRIRCGCRFDFPKETSDNYTASSSENPLRMSHLRLLALYAEIPASSSENPLRMSPVCGALATHLRIRLKLRESAADVAHIGGSRAVPTGPPQAPRIRCGCRRSRPDQCTAIASASSSENPLRMSPRAVQVRMLSRAASSSENPLRMSLDCQRRSGRWLIRLKLRESAADVAKHRHEKGHQSRAASSSENPLRMSPRKFRYLV